ncbi:uncharacterized protein LOC132088082 [Daphnia carinata]|uniref:uncharacterized protein LOC132088082 n=1 Tax=Daphnia carinata TaxID=120202 RepID=UPI0028697116|nr:uncharacterized protein LOC132088082 [Daphnia carinata]
MCNPVVIICGVAGTGKSTLLSHFYSEIKKKKPDCWVIRLNLVEHSDAILKLDGRTPDLMEFLINDLHVIDSNSPFSRLLLNQRFEMGKQIVFMFDGYDEIDKECQKIAIQMMKSIQKKGIQLFVTTRSHVAHHLQYELGQVAYYLENFDVKDQIDCLTKYWKKALELPDGVQEMKIEEFATLLVDRVSKTLKDKERAFIGIPLQCRILAECYQKNVGDIVESNAENDKQLTSKIKEQFKNKKFDLISLYSNLMDTKRQIYRVKTNNTMSNPILAKSFDGWVKKVESWLTKLAVETIITQPSIHEMFWPTKGRNKSSDDVARQEESLAIDSLNFGLTFSNGNGMRPQFLHRTFAEYLVAKYIYEGFHPDDKRHNKLLEKKSIRKFIVKEILASYQYDEVQVFFDSMVKTLVDENEEWSKKINDRKLPKRLTKMVTDKSRNLQPDFKEAVHFSIQNGKGNIFRLFCDCLDATFERHQIFRWVMKPFFQSSIMFFSHTFFEESKFFKRFINYFDTINPHDQNVSGTDDNTSVTIGYLISSMLPKSAVKLLVEKYPLWNRDGHLETMDDFLDFLENQNMAFDECVCSFGDDVIKNFFLYLIYHDKYRRHLKKFLTLLSKYTAYSDDLKLAELLIEVFRSKDQMMAGRVAETLKILQELGRSAVLVQLYGVLSIDPEAFQNICQPYRLGEEDALPTDLNILLGRDSYDMTLLHRAAFYGDVNIVEQILARFRQPELDDGVKQKLRKVVLEGYTPFYFATAKNQKEVCSKLLAFVKDIFPNASTGELTELNVNIHQSFYLAVKSKNAKMFQLTLTVVKKELGHDYLLTQLIAKFTFSGISIFDYCSSKKLFNAMVKIVVNRDDVADYKCLHNVIFNENIIESFVLDRIDAENLQGLLSVEGAGRFTKRLLTDNLYRNFDLLSSCLLKNFNKTQLFDFVKMITLKDDTKIVKSSQSVAVSTVRLSDPTYRDENIQHFLTDYSPDDLVCTPNDGETTTVHAERVELSNSFWGDFLRSTATSLPGRHLDTRQVKTIFKCLTLVRYKLGGHMAKELLLHQDDRGYVVLHLSKEIVQRMLNCLSKKNQEEIKKEWKKNAPPVTHDTFINYDSREYFESWRIALHYSDILLFYLVYGSEKQLGECVDILTSVRLMGRQQRSLWSYIFEYSEEKPTKEILKSVSQIFGWGAAKTLLAHEMDGLPLLLKALSWGRDIDEWLDVLPEEIRKDIQQVIEQKTTEFIDDVFLHPGTYFNELGDPRYKPLTLLKFLIDYSNGRQREQFVQSITRVFKPYPPSPFRLRGGCSIWTWVFLRERKKRICIDIAELDTFLKCVSEKLGTKAVKGLVFHEFLNQPLILYLTSAEGKMVDVMLAHLDAFDRTRIQCQINKSCC